MNQKCTVWGPLKFVIWQPCTTYFVCFVFRTPLIYIRPFSLSSTKVWINPLVRNGPNWTTMRSSLALPRVAALFQTGLRKLKLTPSPQISPINLAQPTPLPPLVKLFNEVFTWQSTTFRRVSKIQPALRWYVWWSYNLCRRSHMSLPNLSSVEFF